MAEPQWNEAQQAKLAESQRYERAYPRRTVLFRGKLEINGFHFSCKVVDLSLCGARVKLDLPLANGTALTLAIQNYPALEGEVVWSRNGYLGLKFITDATDVRATLGALGERLANN